MLVTMRDGMLRNIPYLAVVENIFLCLKQAHTG